jgi:hypothetical protein
METESFTPISQGEALVINGGGFAYDVGRVLRFLYISGLGSSVIGTTMAVIDWEINAALNDPD